MKLGVFTVLFQGMQFESMLDHVKSYGLQAVEIGTGNYPGNAHCNPDELLENESARQTFKKAILDRGLTLSALSCHGNPLHPNPEIAKPFHDTYVKTVRLAELLEVPVVNVFSGCPGDHEGAKYPNWPFMAWPEDYQQILKWQWDEKIIPYWSEWGKFAADHHVKLAFEMHGGFSVHNPDQVLQLRSIIGDVIGANFDPSHMYWQGIDPVEAIKILGRAGAIHHFHAKDTSIDISNTNRHGLLDTQPFGNLASRSWIFRTVGYGHDMKHWSDIVSALRLVGYDDVISIEHEDALMSIEEGFRKAVANLKHVILEEPLPKMWWA